MQGINKYLPTLRIHLLVVIYLEATYSIPKQRCILCCEGRNIISMLANLISSKISEWKISKCFYCINLRIGVQIISIIHTTKFIISLILSVLWINHSYFNQSCFGPISVDIIDNNCSDLLDYQRYTRNHEFSNFHEELLRLSAYFQDFKLHYIPTLILLLIIHLVSIGSGIVLFLGVLLRRKIFLIPWLIVGEVKCVFWTSMFVAIIYIEDKLFIHGRSVFGLFSAVCLFMACLQIYFWILVLSLYCKYDQEEMSKEEYFKLHYGGDRIQGSGAIIRHHNPAFDGIVNAGFGSDSPVIRFNHHLYTNGNASRVVDEEILAMKTFGKDLVQRNGQILDASKLPAS